MNKSCNALLFFSKRIKKFGFFLFEKYSISNKLFTVLYNLDAPTALLILIPNKKQKVCFLMKIGITLHAAYRSACRVISFSYSLPLSGSQKLSFALSPG